jgi:hypothetical protein
MIIYKVSANSHEGSGYPRTQRNYANQLQLQCLIYDFQVEHDMTIIAVQRTNAAEYNIINMGMIIEIIK